MINFYSLNKYILLLLLQILLQSVIFAGSTGKIAGKVFDAKTKEPLIGANVYIAGSSMGAAADVDGNYFIINIPPGTYQIKASAIGYASIEIKNVSVSVDQTTKIDIEMGEQAVQVQTVEITASRPIVQKDLTSTEASISGNNIAMLPVEDVQSVINLQAGVVDGHFRGGRSDEVKYLIDGVAVNDVYSGQSTMEAATNSIQELQVITGTFNAEYGQAMSGIVNQITKIPEDHYNGSFSAYSGDYITSRTNLFQYMGPVNPLRTYNLQGSFSGPVPATDKLIKFFMSGRYLSDDGYLYGKRIFNPRDSSNFSANNPADWYIGATGDGADVPMNYSRQLTLQGKLDFNVGTGKGIVLEALYQKHDYTEYDHMFIYDPDGNYTYHQDSFLGSASYTHMFSRSSFLDLLGSAYTTDYKQYTYENPLDPGYVTQERFNEVGGNALYTGGTENWYFTHNTKTYTAKADFTSQLTNIHEIKAGFEADLNTLDYKDFQILDDATTGYQPQLPQPGAFDYNVYNNHPYQLAAYIQDKIEFDYLIINIGLRYDYFQPDGRALINPNNIAELDSLSPPFPDSISYQASAKHQLSPRLGISYPISDKGAVHISYGHFFQVPSFQYLYVNPNDRIPLTGNYPNLIGSTIGNADLQPQETVMYELGLQQQLTDELGINITTYYKDIRNLLSVAIHVKNNYLKFAEYINQDYGAVNGLTVSLTKKFTDGFGGTIDYTYQVAEGDASDPNDDYTKAQESPPVQINSELVPLNWDRRHSLNFTLYAGIPQDYIISMVGQLDSGLPYTPSFMNERTGLENSASMPTFFNIDLYITKYFKFSGINFSVFAKIYNLFDTANQINVYTDTGSAEYTLAETQAQSAPRGINTLQEYFNRPDFYSAPRQILVGVALDF